MSSRGAPLVTKRVKAAGHNDAGRLAKPLREVRDLLGREFGPFPGDQPLDHPAHLHAGGIRGDVDQTLCAKLAEASLLCLDHDPVLDKGRGDLLV